MKISEAQETLDALRTLMQIRDVYNEGWQPNWNDNNEKYVIIRYEDSFMLCVAIHEKATLCFNSTRVANKFFNEQKELLELAKPVL